MGRILAIDYGQKRAGIAVTDELKIIANGLTTVSSHEIISFLKKYLSEESVECIVVGKPLQMDNSPSESEKYISIFISSVKKVFPDIPLVRIDERFTSKMAFQTMLDSGISKKKRRNKALIDTISATIILQSYLETIK
ncbi:MAG: Holliday junction resolvase RuvX [Bacteroidales bacterium]|jgi:putative Holliday junction resolvase|nr:Holliday junction resolvase RuvX [Bacteroidales bacterium]MDD4214638.1 Holliday junction resolvase RuvX [Bacteroidales bacterium]